MLSKNKFTTYLLYAIGEILLVVVGILIAVSIDDWNQKKENETKLFDHLNTLYSEIQNDSIYFSNRIQHDSLALRYLTAVSKRQFDKVDLSYLSLMLILNENPREFGQMTDRLKQNSLYELIQSSQLKEELGNYASSLDHHNEYSSWHKNYIIHNVEGYLVKNYPIDTLMRIPKSVALDALKNKNLLSLVSFQRSVYSGHINNKQNASDIAQDILLILRSEYGITGAKEDLQ